MEQKEQEFTLIRIMIMTIKRRKPPMELPTISTVDFTTVSLISETSTCH